ncbi:MAG: hypothetical protein HC815_05750 [Richelia sp. RM1_1_1]|nr:hypothetical protein [Richelia sp. RM1_1_1]
MPTTCSRARKWIKAEKAVGKRNKLGVFYVQLLRQPSYCYATQEIVLGTDRRKTFTGIAFPTKLATIALFHARLDFTSPKKRVMTESSIIDLPIPKAE